MPIRFSTQAANEDTLRDDGQPRGAPAQTPQAASSASKARSASVQPQQRDNAADKGGEVKPGKDINAAGFIKDRDSGKT